MNKKPFIVDVDSAEEVLHKFVQEADLDTLAMVLGHVFGCEVYDNPDNIGEEFIVTPTDDYCGGLDEIEISE